MGKTTRSRGCMMLLFRIMARISNMHMALSFDVREPEFDPAQLRVALGMGAICNGLLLRWERLRGQG